jgi:hypothetical protein
VVLSVVGATHKIEEGWVGGRTEGNTESWKLGNLRAEEQNLPRMAFKSSLEFRSCGVGTATSNKKGEKI